MIICPRCNTQNIDEAKFCRSCGSKIEAIVNKSSSQGNVAPKNTIKQDTDDSSSFNIIAWIALAGFLWFLISTSSSKSVTSEAPASESTTESTAEQYVRPSTAPNGQPWPISAGYIDGYDKLNAQGKSSITVDNTQNDSDVFVKLFALDTQQPSPVRHFYIPANSSFTINKVNVGNYDVRYQDLSTGALSRTEQFQIEEVDNGYGIEFSNLTLTIYKVQNGNMETYGLSPSEF